MEITSYNEAEHYLKEHIHRTTSCRRQGEQNLARMRRLMELLGNPQKKYLTILVGGTSGKSSTSFALAKILECAGYKTGLCMSPHLQVVTERMQVNGKFASGKEFVSLINKLKPVVAQVDNEKKWGKVGYFQITLSAALLYFARKGVDVAVVEVGLGGHFDSANVLNPVLSIITNVGLDHTGILGETVEEIARDKSEIIKPSGVVVTAAAQKSVKRLIQEKAKRVGAQVIFAKKEGKDLSLFQKANNAVAETSARILKKQGFPKTTQRAIRKGLVSATLPGRLEVVSLQPLVIIDGAHNPDKASALKKALQSRYPNKKFCVIFAAVHKKHNQKMQKILSPLAQEIFPTSIRKGVSTFRRVSKNHQNLLVTGSFFLVDKIRSIYYPPKKVLKSRQYSPYSKSTSISS